MGMQLAIAKGECDFCGEYTWLYLYKRELRCSYCIQAEENKGKVAEILGIASDPIISPYSPFDSPITPMVRYQTHGEGQGYQDKLCRVGVDKVVARFGGANPLLPHQYPSKALSPPYSQAPLHQRDCPSEAKHPPTQLTQGQSALSLDKTRTPVIKDLSNHKTHPQIAPDTATYGSRTNNCPR